MPCLSASNCILEVQGSTFSPNIMVLFSEVLEKDEKVKRIRISLSKREILSPFYGQLCQICMGDVFPVHRSLMTHLSVWGSFLPGEMNQLLASCKRETRGPHPFDCHNQFNLYLSALLKRKSLTRSAFKTTVLDSKTNRS